MNFKNKALCKVRTITAFLALSADKSQWQLSIQQAADFCAQLSAQFIDNGYTVQSVRIVTNGFGEYLDTSNLAAARADLLLLKQLLSDTDMSGLRVRLAIGEAKTAKEIALLPQLVKEFGDLCNVCVNVGMDEFGVLDNALIEDAAKAVTEISRITPRGEGNFNFTVNFNCDPLIPYFPAGYHNKDLGNRFVIGLETPDLLVHVLKTYNAEHNITHEKVGKQETAHNQAYRGYYDVMSNALQHHIDQINAITAKFVEQHPQHAFAFSGFDSSAAPSKDCNSMASVYEEMGVPYFGAAGTAEASALLTRVFKSMTGVELVGFSGLMLALTEDTGLAQGTIKGHFDIRSLLTYSAVCGIGLDTVPIPGDTPITKISALMRDTGTMAFRLKKPLTVRVFPVPGLSAGDMTAFESDDLCNCAVLAVP